MKSLTRKTIFVLSVTLLFVAISIGYFMTQKNEKDFLVYDGVSIEQWFYGKDGHPGRMTTLKDAEVVFKALGKKSIPYLIEKLRTTDSFFTKTYCKLFLKFPPNVQKKLPPAIDADYVQSIAIHHLTKFNIQMLDPYAKDLIKLYPTFGKNGYSSSFYHLVNHLIIRLDDMELKSSALKMLLQNQDPRIQLESAILLSKTDPSITNTIPVLLNAVTNKTDVGSLMARNNMTVPDSMELLIYQKQKEAHESLNRIAPKIADQVQLMDILQRIPRNGP